MEIGNIIHSKSSREISSGFIFVEEVVLSPKNLINYSMSLEEKKKKREPLIISRSFSIFKNRTV